MKYYFFILFLSICSCKTVERNIANTKADSKNLKDWYQKDFNETSIPGISLNKFISKSKKTVDNTIIVAVLDTQIDTNHEDLKDAIWVNKNEIPNNGIDDDHNGYIDDVHGWNFLGTKSGNYLVWVNFEYTRVVREFNPIFQNKKREEIKSKDLIKFDEYQRALAFQDKWYKYYSNYLKSLKYRFSLYPLAKDTLKHYFPKENYNIKQLDSMYNLYKINDKTYKQRRDDEDKDFGALISAMKINMEKDGSFKELSDLKTQMDSITNKNLNIDYNERKFIGDNENILEKGYGNAKINNKVEGIRTFNGHNTKVSSIIAANRKNNIGIQGFSDNIKIMPLTVSASGDEHDKDISMAIRYAVDNGAKVINMSFTKEFSLHQQWVTEAIQYAEKNNVLIVHISGNDSFNIDENPTYPNDYDYVNRREISNNFINVASISSKLDSTFVSDFSNYGKNNVDLFAPGDQIYTAIPDNRYDFDSGTSLAAPMVSGTAALLWLYYPKLTVQQVKQIILESGTPYDIDVIVPGTKDKKVKFSELSKSGKVLNVYNAMQMAKMINEAK